LKLIIFFLKRRRGKRGYFKPYSHKQSRYFIIFL